MNTRTETYESALDRVCTTTIAGSAAEVDRSGSFPTESIEALSSAGLAGALSSTEFGWTRRGPGRGRTYRAAGGARMRIHRDGSNHALLRCGSTRGVWSGSGPARRGFGYSSKHARVQRGRIAKSFLGANKHGARRRQRNNPRCGEELGYLSVTCDRVCMVFAAAGCGRTKHDMARASRLRRARDSRAV